ncbi:hypothetical protein K438DRAFT_2093770 [Mycena galopus ATCC 62051]|nr:hypothetical protein K438DRAFT_2093770 [Mycena galopus ATCC 62051]
MHLRGGCSSDIEDDDYVEDSDAPGPSNRKRKRKITVLRPRKSATKATDAALKHNTGIQVTVGNGHNNGIYVDRVVHLESAPENWEVLDDCVAYILDVSDTPECLKFRNKVLTVDGMIKKQCQDSLTGPTGSSKLSNLAQVLILEDDNDMPVVVDCRRSNLSCGGFYTCSFVDEAYLENFERCETDSKDLISAPIRAAKTAEAGSFIAIVTEFYQSVHSKYCQGTTGDSDFACGDHAIMCKYSEVIQGPNDINIPSDIRVKQGPVNEKAYFIGCSNWSKNDSITHRFTKIPHSVQDLTLRKIFRGEAVQVDDDDVVSGPCQQIVHPSHLPNNKLCPRTHFRDGKHVCGRFIKQDCPAKLLILIPADEGNMHSVVIPAAGKQHNHPLFSPTKVPFTAATASTRALLKGKLPQEIHPSLINTRKRRELVFDKKVENFPYGTAVWHEFELDRAREPGDRYIHAVNTLADDTHVIVTVNPELAALTLEASWIMVETTFVVVHGKTNEWKLLVWLNDLDRCTVIGRVWSNRATREAFVLVWNGIFEDIQTITGQSLNFKVFSRSSSLLGALGDSEGAQAQALGDVIILRRLNLKPVDGVATVDVDTILMFVWKTCLVHFQRIFSRFPTWTQMQTFKSITHSAVHPKTQTEGYPWLLPSLNRKLSRMSSKFWDLTPRDTNPIEGSHAHNNQVNKTNATLLEAILSARQFDEENAQIIKASLESGIWENGNNSIRARFSSQAARQSRSRQKKAEVNSDPATKGLQSLLKATEKVSKEKDLEIQRLNARLNDLSRPVASSSQRQLEASTPCRGRSIKSLNNCQGRLLREWIWIWF